MKTSYVLIGLSEWHLQWFKLSFRLIDCEQVLTNVTVICRSVTSEPVRFGGNSDFDCWSTAPES